MGAGHEAPARQFRGRRLRSGTALIALVGLVAVGCSSDDAEDTEVAGAVLERDGDGQPTGPSDPDDARVDPRGDDDGSGANGDGTSDGAATGDAASPDQQAGAAADEGAGSSSGGGPSTTPGGSGTTPGPEAVTPPAATPPSTPAPTRPPAAPGPVRDDPPATETPRTERRTIDNPYEPPPPPPPEPEPVDLPAGRGLTGTSVFFGPDGVELGGGAAAVQGAALRSDASHQDGRLSCDTSVYAPTDRRMRVLGEVEVRIQHEDLDGVITELRRQLLRVDVTVPAAQSLRLPAGTPWPFEQATTRSLSCESIYRPW
jgi:hypothetical protein